MSGENSRRGFIAGALAMGGGLVLLSNQRTAFGALSTAEPQLLLFDPQRADACRSVAGGAGHGCAIRPIAGDRVRFAREILASPDCPEIVSGLTNFADFILLSGCAAEHGYRVLSERVQPAPANENAGGVLVSWKIARMRRATSFG
jgi:hypothetical protein